MDIEPIVRSSLAEQIAAAIRRRILSGELKPGDKLPPERELAPQFGTNRNTLREAVRCLEGWKLVSVRHGDGVRVRNFRTEADATILPHFLVEGDSVAERVAVLGDLLTWRRIVLAEAASLAAQRADTADVARLSEMIERIEQTLPDGDIAELDFEFYRRLVEASHSLVSTWTFNTIREVFVAALPAVRSLWVTPPNYMETLRGLLVAIKENDAEGAGRMIDTYFKEADAMVLGTLSSRTWEGGK